jgi:hypothetical protein
VPTPAPSMHDVFMRAPRDRFHGQKAGDDDHGGGKGSGSSRHHRPLRLRQSPVCHRRAHPAETNRLFASLSIIPILTVLLPRRPPIQRGAVSPRPAPHVGPAPGPCARGRAPVPLTAVLLALACARMPSGTL